VSATHFEQSRSQNPHAYGGRRAPVRIEPLDEALRVLPEMVVSVETLVGLVDPQQLLGLGGGGDRDHAALCADDDAR
jgi:hypothetical protein